MFSGPDGAGTKFKLAFMADKHNTIGQDGVAFTMWQYLISLVQGAEPLFFQLPPDYDCRR